jgi:hypothetical protein
MWAMYVCARASSVTIIGIMICGTTFFLGLSFGKSIPVAEFEALNEDNQVCSRVI